ncbi:MAG: CDP-diacylglycerol--glycerol-3-phosphate 3-phosphatidyltransferase [Atopostipes suicloacalis]|nr:CDP-diacylglycerol--glycerol-3-phosphate 3-phosphatidyltransferase [Atopostipes suicloacalis]MDN6731748.1 CDP-diacylglycerol--glycerol-3-phosphate 3-phosphatidyltransferase [Atopostipes suicloacalis]
MNLPNKLTFLRLLLIPIFILLTAIPFGWGTFEALGSEIPYALLFAMILFVFASLTDLLDGYIARRDNLVTNFGKFADPLADKLLVSAALIMLVGLDRAPAWVVVIIIARELAVTGLRLLLVEEGGTVLAAALPGKIKTVTQMLAVILLLVDNFPFAGAPIPIGESLLYVSLFFTVYSGIDYFYNARHIFRDSIR